MKFTNGYWMTKEGVAVNSPQEVIDYQVTDNEVTCYVPYKKIESRGDTLNIGMTTMRVTTPHENILRIRLTHFDQETKGPKLTLNSEKQALVTKMEDDSLVIQSGALSVEVPLNRQAFQLTFKANGAPMSRIRTWESG